MFIQFEAKYNLRAAFAFLFHFSQKNFPEESSRTFWRNIILRHSGTQ